MVGYVPDEPLFIDLDKRPELSIYTFTKNLQKGTLGIARGNASEGVSRKGNKTTQCFLPLRARDPSNQCPTQTWIIP